MTWDDSQWWQCRMNFLHNHCTVGLICAIAQVVLYTQEWIWRMVFIAQRGPRFYVTSRQKYLPMRWTNTIYSLWNMDIVFNDSNNDPRKYTNKLVAHAGRNNEKLAMDNMIYRGRPMLHVLDYRPRSYEHRWYFKYDWRLIESTSLQARGCRRLSRKQYRRHRIIERVFKYDNNILRTDYMDVLSSDDEYIPSASYDNMSWSTDTSICCRTRSQKTSPFVFRRTNTSIMYCLAPSKTNRMSVRYAWSRWRSEINNTRSAVAMGSTLSALSLVNSEMHPPTVPELQIWRPTREHIQHSRWRYQARIFGVLCHASLGTHYFTS